MVKSLFTGVTGLKSHQQRMDMIGNNIANVNTIGFKTDVMTFADVYYQTKRNPSAPTATLGGINPRQVGYGVKVSSVEANLSQSGFNYTDSKTDIALDGKGFFQLMDGAGNIYYTRAGHFKFDEAGYLVNDDGYHVLGVTGECDGVAASSDIIRAIIPQTSNTVSSATKLVNGTNVTVSVSAPSDYTNMSVAFKDADFPFASYANGILTVFFDMDQQFESATDFDNEIQKALTAGGVNLPDDVELSIEFDPIPDDINSKAAKNLVQDFKFTTVDATCRFHISRPSATGGKDHAYIDFSVQDNTVNDNAKLTYGGVKGAVKVDYDASTGWEITIFDDTTSSDINTALNIFLSADENSQVPKMSCT
ncbi:MAG: flagellar hook-basal body complex protein, partial [Oscillospiraceae bacterium]|nr:flagellar hook-basal body complex protein [Oscillospiraceae bacterium]